MTFPRLFRRRTVALGILAIAAAFLLARLAVRLWLSVAAPQEHHGSLLQFWIIESILGALLLAVGGGLLWYIVQYARQKERAQAHEDRLAELGLLSGGLAHEIRNTLNAMRTHLALLRRYLAEEPNPKTATQINRLEEAIGDLESLTTDFLAFARPPRDVPEETDPSRLFDEVLDFIGLDLEQAGVEVETQIEPNVPSVYLDVGKMKRALMNLIVNARQAMPEGGKITLRARPGRRGEVVLEVADTGCGISEDEFPKIFQTFFTTKSDGTGLGLPVVKRTVEDCGGRIECESEVGRGTTFRILLPAAAQRRLRLARQEALAGSAS